MYRKLWLVAPALSLAMVSCGGGSSSSSTAEWCDLAEQIDSTSDELGSLDFSDPAAIEEAFNGFRASLTDAAKVAPKEIKDDVETSIDAFDGMIKALEDADYNILDVDQTAFENISNEASAASDRIEAFNKTECGLTPSDGDTSDEDTTDSGATESTSAGSGEADQAGGEPSDSSAGNTARDQMAAQFEQMGLTAEEASCLADNLDISQLSGGGTPDTSQILNLFTECGIDLSRLAEIGQNLGGG